MPENSFAQQLQVHAKQHVERLFASGVKEIAPLAILHLRGKLLGMPFKADSAEEENSRKSLVITALRLSRALGEFEALATIAEAWISQKPEYAKGGKRPSHDPDRIDAAVFSIRTNDEYYFEAFRVEDNGKRKKLGEPIQFMDIAKNPDLKVEAWFDPGFEAIPPFPIDKLRMMREAYNALLPAFSPFDTGTLEKN